jgi:hypothetical protein
MPRTSMAGLISRLRLVIGDPVGTPTFTDDELESALDAHRERHWDVLLEPVPPYPPYKEYAASVPYWEADEVLEAGGSVVVPSTSDRIAGRWSFASGMNPPVFLTGTSYDLEWAARDVLGWWLAKIKAQPSSFSADGISITRKTADDIMALLKELGGRGPGTLRNVRMTRSDVAP